MAAISSPGTKRVLAIDILRGIVMVIMALDHTRDFFSDFKFEPTDLRHAGTIMFLTRWITHFCAPVFVFLSGTSAFLSLGRGLAKKDAALKLLTRGLWLIVLELTLVREGWTFDFNYSLVFLQVIWAIGCSMIALSALIFLPQSIVLAFGLLMIFGHNMLDNIHPAPGAAGVLWQVLHVQSPVLYGRGNTIMIFYPLIPWIGVMAVGYCFGSIIRKDERQRDRLLYGIGISAIVLFIVLRWLNVYGDPAPWKEQGVFRRTVLSFINCTKYPPSLLYLLMTLGPAIVLMPFLEKLGGVVARVFTVYGRVPLFYYIIHLYLIHTMALVASYFLSGNAPVEIFSHPGYSLPVVYLFWLTAVIILYFPCRWFMQVKMNYKKWWLSYL
jgi:uncharacterized membrane protein